MKIKCEGSASLAFIDAPCAYKAPSFIGTLSVGVEGLLGHNPAHLKPLQGLHGMGFQKCGTGIFREKKNFRKDTFGVTSRCESRLSQIDSKSVPTEAPQQCA